MLGVVHHISLDLGGVHTHGKGVEPTSFLGIVVVHKADATAAHVGILPQHTLNKALYLLGMLQIVFYYRGGIDGGYVEVRRNATNFLVLAAYQTVTDANGAQKDQDVTTPEH